MIDTLVKEFGKRLVKSAELQRQALALAICAIKSGEQDWGDGLRHVNRVKAELVEQLETAMGVGKSTRNDLIRAAVTAAKAMEDETAHEIRKLATGEDKRPGQSPLAAAVQATLAHLERKTGEIKITPMMNVLLERKPRANTNQVSDFDRVWSKVDEMPQADLVALMEKIAEKLDKLTEVEAPTVAPALEEAA